MEANADVVSLNVNFPLLRVQDGFIVSRHRDVTVAYEVEWPEVFTMGASDYETVRSALNSAFRNLESVPWVVVHRQDIYGYAVYGGGMPGGGMLSAAAEGHFNGRRYLRHVSRLYITFSCKANVMELHGRQLFFGSLFTSKMPSRRHLELCLDRASQFVMALGNTGKVRVRRLMDEDLVPDTAEGGVIQEYWNLGRRSPVLNSIEEFPDRLNVGDEGVRCYAVADTGVFRSDNVDVCHRVDRYSGDGSEVFLSGAASLGILLDCEHMVNTYMVTVPNEGVREGLQKKSNRMWSLSKRNADNRVNAEQIDESITLISEGGSSFAYFHMNVMFWGKGDALEDSAGKVANQLGLMNINAVPAMFDAPVLFWAGCPGGGAELGRDNWLTQETNAVTCFHQYETFARGVPGGVVRLTDRMTHVPLFVDVAEAAMREGLIFNMNGFVLGGSGSGKSFYMNNLLQCLYDYREGSSIFVIDRGDSYELLTQVIREESGGRDGVYMSWNEDTKASFTPFEGVSGWIRDGVLNVDDNGFIAFRSALFLMWTPEGGWTSDRVKVLDQMIYGFVRLWMSVHGDVMPVFQDFYDYVVCEVLPRITYIAPQEKDGGPRDPEDVRRDEVRNGFWCGELRVTSANFDISRFILSIQSYALRYTTPSGEVMRGHYGFLLNGREFVNMFDSRFTVVEVSQLKDSDPVFYSLVVLYIMESFERKMVGTYNFKALVIDEAWKAIANDMMADYVMGLYRTARKYNCSATLVSQTIDDVTENAVIGKAIIDNSSVKTILGQENMGGFGVVQKALNLTDQERGMVASLNRSVAPGFNYKEVFIKWGSVKSGVYAVEVSGLQAVAFESKKQRKAPVHERAAELSGRGVDRPYCVALKEVADKGGYME